MIYIHTYVCTCVCVIHTCTGVQEMGDRVGGGGGGGGRGSDGDFVKSKYHLYCK